MSGDKETYKRKLRELLEKEEIKVNGKKIEQKGFNGTLWGR